MNNNQKIVLVVAAVTLVLSSIVFPHVTWIDVSTLRSQRYLDLLAEWVCIGIVATVAYVVLADKKGKENGEQPPARDK